METESAYARRKAKKEVQIWQAFKELSHEQLMAHLCDRDPWKCTAAVQELHMRNSEDALRDAMQLCHSPDPVAREHAALVLGQLNFSDDEEGRETGRKVVDLLYALAVGDPRARVRAGAICALGHRGSRGADHTVILKAVENGSRERSSTIREYVAFAMGGLNLPGAEVVLLRLLGDKNRNVRDWAAFAVFMQEDEKHIVYDTPEIRQALLNLASGDDESVRYEAFRSLGVLREKRAAPMLARELQNEDVFDYDLAKAAGRMGDPLLIPVLEKALERFGDDTDMATGKGIISTALKQLRGGRG